MKKQMIFQKLVCLIALLAAAIAFFFSLGLLTDIYKLMFAVGVRGSELFKQMQPFNRQLVIRCIAMILLAVLLYVTRTQLRRRYYISNYVAIGGTVILNVLFSSLSIARILEYKRSFLTEVDFEAWLALRVSIPDFPYTESTLWLDLNIAMQSLVIAASLLLVINLLWKTKLMKFEDKLLSGKIKPGSLQLEV